MPVAARIRIEIDIPQGANTKFDGTMLKVEGKQGKTERPFKNPKVSIVLQGKKIILETEFPSKREKALIGTWEGHVNNMLVGVIKGFECKMKMVNAHFPMKVTVKGSDVIVENFLGGRCPRTAAIVGDTKVDVKKDELVLTGSNKETVGQTAANIERSTKIRGFDPRVFQDGIYITGKCKVRQ